MEKSARTATTKIGHPKQKDIRDSKEQPAAPPPESDDQTKELDEKKRDEKKELQEQTKQLTEGLQRLQAEFANYKKANEKQQERFQQMTKVHFVQKLLPIIDAFETALTYVSAKDEFYQGMQMLYQQLWKILTQEGLRPIEITNKAGEGKIFDPHYHEVMLKLPSEAPEDTIIGEVQRGYMLDDLVLRHSKVKVSAGPEKRETNKETTNEEQKKESEGEKEAKHEDSHRTTADNKNVEGP